MSDPSAAPGGSEAGVPTKPRPRDLRAALPTAAGGGFLVAAAALALGQIPPLLVNLFGGGLALSTQIRLGWLYTAAANAIPIHVEGFGSPGETAARVVVRVVPLTLTFVIGWLLVRAGAASAEHVEDRPSRRAIAGMLVAAPYALVIGSMAVLVELRLGTDGTFLPASVTFRAVAWQAIAISVVLAGFAGAVGGLNAGSGLPRRVRDAVGGGWRAFAWGLALAVVGVLAFAAVRPTGLQGYVGEVRSLGPRGAAAVVGHQGLLAPDQAVLVLVPAMGSCDTISTPDRVVDVLCLDRQPSEENPLAVVVDALADRAIPTRALGGAAWLFLMVPFVAVAAGARHAALRAQGTGEAVVLGMASGAVFAALVSLAVVAGTVSIAISADDGATTRRLAFGAPPLEAGLYALAWGVVVGGATGVASHLLRAKRPNPA